MTAAVTEALREQLERVRGKHGTNLADRLIKIGKDCTSAGTLSVGRSWGVAVKRERLAAMIIDASAIIAILREEPEARSCAEAIAGGSSRGVSTVNYPEAGAAIDGSRNPVASRRFDELLREVQLIIEPVTEDQTRIAREAFAISARAAGISRV